MRKWTFLSIISFSIMLFSGCSLGGGRISETGGSVLKSTDGGEKWENKVKINDEKSISNVDVLVMKLDPFNSKVIYIGTKESGLFKTEDGGESWKKLEFPPVKIYDLVVDRWNSQVLYVVGVWEERGKIYKSEDSGSTWKEIYTEPANGTLVLSLAMSPTSSQVVYAGTSEGAIFKTENGGATWINLTKASEPVGKIVFDPLNAEITYFVLFEKNILRTKDGGKTFDDLDKKIKGDKLIGMGGQVYTLTADPRNSGVIYAGLEKGVLKSSDFGDTWSQINTLESSRGFPIRSIAINPSNTGEIIFSAAQAIYKSTDGGNQWSTFQLQTSKIVSVIQYDHQNTSNLYLGMRAMP